MTDGSRKFVNDVKLHCCDFVSFWELHTSRGMLSQMYCGPNRKLTECLSKYNIDWWTLNNL
jgi:hypothetical protein